MNYIANGNEHCSVMSEFHGERVKLLYCSLSCHVHTVKDS